MTNQDLTLVPSTKDFYLIQLVNDDCTIHPMIILDKKDNKCLVIISTEVTLDSNIDIEILSSLIEAACIYDEAEIEALWLISNNEIDNVNANVIEISDSHNFTLSCLSGNDEMESYPCEIISKWNLNSYKEAF